MNLKLFSLFLTLVIGLETLNAEVYNGTCGAEGDGSNLTWTYNTEDSTLTISGVGAMKDYNNSTYSPWYSYRNYLKAVTISNNVTSIGDYAFVYSSVLISISIPNSVTSIGNSAFYYCTGLTSLTIPNSVTNIGDWAFYCCTNLKSIDIPNGIASIGVRVFCSCRSLTSVDIPNSVTSIGEYAFYGCNSLTSVNLPDNVISVGYCAFNNCIGLNSPVYNAHVFAFMPTSYAGTYTIIDGVEFIAGSAFNGCTDLTGVYIPSSVKGIGDAAFHGCSSLTSINIPDSVTSIENSLFSGCSALTSINIPNSVTSIGTSAFSGCFNLTSINIPQNVTSIGGTAFYGCTGLNTVTIPNSVESIGKRAFYGCSGLSSITISRSVKSIDDEAFYGCTSLPIIDNIRYADTYMVEAIDKSLSSYTIKEKTRWIGSSAFYQCTNLTSISLPDSLLGVGSYAFSGCKNLNTLIIPDNVTVIGDYAFSGCSGLTSVNIPDDVTSIGILTFSSCSSLNSIIIPDGVTKIGTNAFSNCSSLSSITCKAINPPVLDTNKKGVFNGVDKSIPLYVPGSSITAYKAADQWNEFTNILAIPGTEPCIIASGTCGDNITWELSCDSVLTISGSGTMTNWSARKYVPWSSYRSAIKSTIIGSSVTSIGDYAFCDFTSLLSVTIPNSIKSIGIQAFKNCQSLTSVTLNSDEIVCKKYSQGSSIRDIFGKQVKEYVVGQGIESIGNYAFGNCDSLLSVTLPQSVTTIGDSAFYSCKKMYSVVLPNGITRIGNAVFYGCAITSINLPKNVVSIGSDAFKHCRKMTSIDLGNVQTIGNYAFRLCDALRYIDIPASVSTIGEGIFLWCDSLENINVSEESQNFCSVGGIMFDKYRNTLIHYPGGKKDTIYTIPSSVDSIAAYAFYFEYRKFTNIICEAVVPPVLDTTAFLPYNYQLYVPAESLDAYKSAPIWKDFYNILPIPGTEPCEPQIRHDTIETCQGEMIPWIPMTISTNMPGSYDYYDSLKNIMGCDSILHYHVIVHPSYEFLYDTTVYVGDEIRWRNWNFKPEKAGRYQYFDTLRTYFDCDSVFVLNLEVKPRSQKMCSWLVESNDLEMGAIITNFTEPFYKYGTQITVEASPNSGYKFVKWNDGKKYNPYKFSLLDDKYLLAIFMEEEGEQDTTTVQPFSTSATFTWPFIVGGFSYSLTIYLDAAYTIPFCTITFNQYGQFIGISFGNRAPRRSMEQEDGFTYTVSGLDANTEYYFKMETMDEDNKLINTDEGAFRTTNDATGIENQYNTVIEHRKVMINGQIYILRGDKTYTLQGQEVK